MAMVTNPPDNLESEEDPLRAIPARLRSGREALGLSPAELASRLGISTRAYLAWEEGKRQRWMHMCVRLVAQAKAPISSDYLIFGDDRMLFSPAQRAEIQERIWADQQAEAGRPRRRHERASGRR
jgi:transcriptional regulator with XRE-family HTH domain